MNSVKKKPRYRVFFVDVTTGKPAMRTKSVSLKIALGWVEEWETDPRGHVAVVWPCSVKGPPRIRPVRTKTVPRA